MGRSRHGIIGPDDPTISYFNGIYSQFHRFIKEHVDSLQPDKQNRYVYCYNNPINLIDPLGLEATLKPLEQKIDDASTAEQQGQLKSQDGTKTDDKTNENPGKTSTDVEQKENVSTDTATQTEEIGEQNGGGSVSEEGGGVWGFIRDLSKFVLEGLRDEACRTFEGSQYGVGVGFKGKIKIGPVKLEVGMEAIEGERLTREGPKSFYQEKAGISGQIGPWKPSLTFEESGISFKPWTWDIKGLSMEKLLTIELGGTTPIHYISGAAKNFELHINLIEFFNTSYPRE